MTCACQDYLLFIVNSQINYLEVGDWEDVSKDRVGVRSVSRLYYLWQLTGKSLQDGAYTDCIQRGRHGGAGPWCIDLTAVAIDTADGLEKDDVGNEKG